MKRVHGIAAQIKRPFAWFRRTRRRNKVFTIIGLLIVVAIIGGQVAAAFAPPPYVMQKVQRGDIVQLVSETGNVETAGRVDVNSTATGIIEEIYVENNDQATIGQNLFKVRSTATDEEKAAANATYQNALSAATTAKQTKEGLDAAMWTSRQAYLEAQNARNYKNGHSTNPATDSNYTALEKENIDAAVVTTEKDFKLAEKKYKEADIAVTAAQADLTSASLGYQATKDVVVKAPAAGTITNLSYRVGDKVTAGGSLAAASAASGATAGLGATSGGSPVLTIANLTSYAIKLSINEVDVPKVKVGQAADITLDAFAGRNFKGIITHIDQVGTNTQGVVTYNVVIDITDPVSAIRPGMTANVDVSVDKVEDVLTVSNSAIKPYKGGRSVRIVDPETKQPKNIPVQVGLKGESKSEIIKGVSEGQEVITALTNDQVQQSNSPF